MKGYGLAGFTLRLGLVQGLVVEGYGLARVALRLGLHLVLAVFGCQASVEARQTLDGQSKRQII